MEQLLKDNGYNYLRTLNGGFVAYYNAAEKAAYILHPAQLDGKPSLRSRPSSSSCLVVLALLLA